MVIEWDMPKSSEVVTEAATGFVVAGLAAGCCVIDEFRQLFGVCASVKLFFLLLDEGAVTRPMTLVSAMYTAIGYFLPSAGVFSPTAVGIASVAPPSSVVLRPGVVGFITGVRVHDLWGLRLFSLMWLPSVAIARSLLIHLFDSLTLTLV